MAILYFTTIKTIFIIKNYCFMKVDYKTANGLSGLS